MVLVVYFLTNNLFFPVPAKAPEFENWSISNIEKDKRDVILVWKVTVLCKCSFSLLIQCIISYNICKKAWCLWTCSHKIKILKHKYPVFLVQRIEMPLDLWCNYPTYRVPVFLTIRKSIRHKNKLLNERYVMVLKPL